MEQQSSVDPSSQTPPQLSLSIRNLPLIIGGIVLMVLIGVGSYVLGTKSQQNNVISQVPTEAPMMKVTSAPIPTTMPSVTAVIDETTNWKIYSDKNLSFKYPSAWKNYGQFILESSSPKIRIAIAESTTMMNECMEQSSVENKDGFVLRNFKRVNTGAMCSGGDANELETWIVKNTDSYGPGIQISYSANELTLTKPIIQNLIATFKFTQ